MQPVWAATNRWDPRISADSATFWEQAAEKVRVDGVRLRQRERLSAVALVKRFAGRHFWRKNWDCPIASCSAGMIRRQWRSRMVRQRSEKLLLPTRSRCIRRGRRQMERQWLPRRVAYQGQANDDAEEECPIDLWDVIIRADRTSVCASAGLLCRADDRR